MEHSNLHSRKTRLLFAKQKKNFVPSVANNQSHSSYTSCTLYGTFSKVLIDLVYIDNTFAYIQLMFNFYNLGIVLLNYIHSEKKLVNLQIVGECLL